MLPPSCMNCVLKYCGKSYKSHVFNRSLLRRFANIKNNNAFNLPTVFPVEHYSQISTMPTLCAKALHSTKGWKHIARDGGKQDSDYSPVACEDGNEAIPHSVVVSELQNCSSVASQIESFSSLISLTPEDIERRKAFLQSIDEALKIYFSHFKTYQFGSSVNGLGFTGCDSDVCLQTNFNNEDYLLQKEVPTLQSVLDGTVSQETILRLNPLFMLRFVRRILRQHCPEIKGPILLVKARCPILRFYDAKYNVFCDFSCENKSSLQNTKLLRLICNFDERFSSIAKVIRYWGKYGGFVGDIEMFNSYSFSLLIIHFLQCTNPPVLPSVQEMICKSEYLKNGSVDDRDLLLKDLQNFSPTRNAMTTEELLKKFFFYYLNYDFSRIMQPFTSSSLPISCFVPDKDLEDTFEFGTVNIQDPFRHSFNSTCAASFKTCKRLLNGLLHACDLYQDRSSWVPQTEMWGLCSLFQPPISEQKIHMKWQQNHSFRMTIPAFPEPTAKLRRIFEHGLLFHCTEFNINRNNDHGSDSKPVTKIHCKTNSKTWQGRDLVLKYENNYNNPLDLEHAISTELLSKTENQRQNLLEFYCECSEVMENNEILMLTIHFKGKFPPNVAVFLKEYIPCIFRKL